MCSLNRIRLFLLFDRLAYIILNICHAVHCSAGSPVSEGAELILLHLLVQASSSDTAAAYSTSSVRCIWHSRSAL